MNPKYPLYIVSKGRWESRQTAKALTRMGVPFYIVVERQEYDAYAAVIEPSSILILDPAYQEQYDTYDMLGATKSRGPGPARNFAWAHAQSLGAAWHWVMDDNIRGFIRYNNNQKIPAHTGAIFRAMEEFAERYENLVMVGPQYDFFVIRKKNIWPPFVLNTRIYSCNLIRNDLPWRWRGRYNEDTDLSLRILKAGLCTAQFNAFLQEKAPTQTVKGGNDADFYSREGTLAKSKMQVAMHPDVSRLTARFGRWHHYVDYRPFRANALKLRADYVPSAEPNEFGMRYVLTGES